MKTSLSKRVGKDLKKVLECHCVTNQDTGNLGQKSKVENMNGYITPETCFMKM
jgi:hypothetical protein